MSFILHLSRKVAGNGSVKVYLINLDIFPFSFRTWLTEEKVR